MKNVTAPNEISQRVWNYIRQKNMFVFSDVILVTEVTAKYLMKLLEKYIKNGIIELRNNVSSITNRQYTILKKLDIKEGVISHSTKNAKGYGRRVETHIIEHFISVKDYRKSKEYRQRIRVLKLLQNEIGMEKLKELSKVSITSVRQVVKESYPNPQKMMNTIIKNLNFDIEKLGQIRTNLDVKEFVRSYKCNL